MKKGDKILCVKDYIEFSDIIINIKGKEYTITSIENFHGDKTDTVVGITTETGTKNVFWLKYQQLGDNWNEMRANNLLENFFLYGKKLRKQKLEKLNNIHNDTSRNIEVI